MFTFPGEQKSRCEGTNLNDSTAEIKRTKGSQRKITRQYGSRKGNRKQDRRIIIPSL